MIALLSLLWAHAGELLITIIGIALVVWMDPNHSSRTYGSKGNGRAQH